MDLTPKFNVPSSSELPGGVLNSTSAINQSIVPMGTMVQPAPVNTDSSIVTGPNTFQQGFGNNIFKISSLGIHLGNAVFNLAPFSVDMQGNLIATSATISGSITATTGAIGGFSIGADYLRDTANTFGLASTVTGSNDVRLWAGDTFANRATAPFRVYEDGSVVATALSITSIDIGGADNTSMHVDVDGNMWLGAATFDLGTNPFAVSKTGELRAVNGFIGGWNISTTALSTGAFDTAGTRYFGDDGLSLSDTFKVTPAGAITAVSGTIGGFTLGTTSMYAGIIKTAATVGVGNTGVIMDTAGLRGYDATLGLTFNLPTNGDAPTFSSGIISNTIYEINTSAVLRTSTTVGDGTALSAGILINDTGIYGVAANQTAANANVRILTDGSGYFRGTFNIGGTTITIDNTQDIQTNLDIIDAAGGGTLYLQPGTYTLTADLIIPANTNLEGTSRDNCIIECDIYSVKMSGSNAYSTGTVTINNGDTTVVGSGTTFTSGMVGRNIFLDGFWYEITAFTDTTHITIATYEGVNLAGAIYVLATKKNNPKLTKLTIQNSTGSAIQSAYSDNPIFDDLSVYGSVIGIDLDYCLYPVIQSYTVENAVNLDMNYVTGPYIKFSSFDSSTSGEGAKASNMTLSSIYSCTFAYNTTIGFSMTNCDDNAIFDSNFNGNGTNGASLTNCTNGAFNTVAFGSNGAKGIEFISGNTDFQISDSQVAGNTSDGIKITATSDRITVVATSIINNGGYGINIAASTCDNNQIIAPAFDNNTSGNINDSGTNTVILPNIPYLLASQDLVAGAAVGISNIAGGIAKAKLTASTVSHGVASQTFSGLRNSVACPIGGDKFVYLLYSTAGSDTLYAQVGSINRATMAMTLGTALTVGSSFTPVNTALQNACVCKLDTDKFIVFWLDDASTTNIKYRVGTVSGTTITFSAAAATAITAGSTVATSLAFVADQISTDKGIFCFKAATTANSKMVAFTVSGTTATFSVTPVTPGTNSQLNVTSAIKKVATDKYVLVTEASSTSLYAQVCTLSGTVITAGTEVQISTTSMNTTSAQDGAGTQIISPDTDVFVFRIKNGSSGSVNVTACTISGTTPTAGATLNINNGTGGGSGGGLFYFDTTTIYVTGSTGVAKITRSGTILTDAGNALAINSIQTEITILLDNGYPVCLEVNPTTTSAWIYGMSNNFIGYLQTTTSRGVLGAVNIKGQINSAQSGLTPGLYYTVGSGGLTTVASDGGITAISDLDISIAINSTQIIT